MKTKHRLTYSLLVMVLAVTLIIPRPVLAAMPALEEVRFWLQNSYVDPVPEEVLNAPTIEEILERLGDPYTNYLTAEQYSNFYNSIEGKFCGIGIYLQMVDQGLLITGIIEGSPAEARGLKSGDIIIQAGGQSLAGMSSEQAIPYIKGPEGTTAELVILRDNTTFQVTVERRTIIIPSIKATRQPHDIGCLDINSFGTDTASLFASSLEDLRRQNARAYIIDLRSNSGGYVHSALDIAGYFIGSNTAMQTRYHDGQPRLESAVQHDHIIDRPAIFLINKNTASASEILAGAVRDYNKALFIGSNTFGKGCMQYIVQLDCGDYLKMTVARFYSPLGHDINKVGINPDLLIEKTNPLRAAELLLSAPADSADKTNLVRLEVGGQLFGVDTREARQPDNWPVYSEILNHMNAARIMIGRGGTWDQAGPGQLENRWPLYYPGYQWISSLDNIPAVGKQFTLRFSREVNWQTVNNDTVQLVRSDSGELIPLTFAHPDPTTLQAAPARPLEPGATYWLLAHPGICDLNAKPLKTGVISIVKAAQ